MIKFQDPFNNEKLTDSDIGLINKNKSVVYPKINGITRVIKDQSNYTDNFGYQWNKFQKTQIDKENGKSKLSFDRFFSSTNWKDEDLSNKVILEVGAGAGRFTHVVLNHTNAKHLFSIDYSNAVEANYKNNISHKDRLSLFQASVYEMPFEEKTFDKVFCFGVLQHTPNFKKSIESLIKMLKPGGELIVDFYPIKGWYTKMHSKYILRPFTKGMSNEKLLRLIENNVDWMIKTSLFFNKIQLGKFLNRFIPLCDIKNTLPNDLDYKELKEWVILDTFDMFSPAFDNPQKITTVHKWFEEFGVKVNFSGFINYQENKTAAIVKGIKK